MSAGVRCCLDVSWNVAEDTGVQKAVQVADSEYSIPIQFFPVNLANCIPEVFGHVPVYFMTPVKKQFKLQ